MRTTIGLTVVTGLVGCSVSASGGARGGSMSVGVEGDEEDRQGSFDRSVPPSVGSPPSMSVPERQVFELSNGLPVHVVEDHDLPIVSIEVHIGSYVYPSHPLFPRHRESR